MDQVAAKCYLGIAIEEVIKDMGLEKKAKKIYDTYFESFKQYYDVFRKNFSEHSRVDGKLSQHFEYPIGDKETLQYYLAYGEMKFSVASLKHQQEHPTMLQGFSTNEGAKGKSNKRNRKQGGAKCQGENGRKRKNV